MKQADKIRDERLREAMKEANADGDMVHMTVRIFEHDRDLIRILSEEADVNISSIIRASIHYYLADQGYY